MIIFPGLFRQGRKLANARSEHGGVRDHKYSVVRAYRDVGEPDPFDPHVDNPKRARADSNVVTNSKRASEEQHERSEDIRQALLGRNSNDNAGHSGSDEQALGRDANNRKYCEQQDDVAHARRHEPDGRPGGFHRLVRNDASEQPGNASNRNYTRENENRGANPLKKRRVSQRGVSSLQIRSHDQRGEGHESDDDRCH